MNSSDDKLYTLLLNVLLIDTEQYNDDYGPDEIETWDSLATMQIATAIAEVFGYTMKPEELVSIGTIGDIKNILMEKGIY